MPSTAGGRPDALPHPAASPEPRLPDRGAFVTTHGTVVLAAGRSNTTHAQAALEQLCRTYWRPLYAYVRRAGYSPDDSEDLTQGFFARLLAQNLVPQADPLRGRFRSFLLASLKHYLAHEAEKRRTWKRGGRSQRVPSTSTRRRTCARPTADPQDTPDGAFDRHWALALLESSLPNYAKNTRMRVESACSWA